MDDLTRRRTFSQCCTCPPLTTNPAVRCSWGWRECKLFAIVWLHSLEESAEVEHQVIKGLGISVVDRAILMHHYTRMGHLLDATGRDVGHVAWVAAVEG